MEARGRALYPQVCIHQGCLGKFGVYRSWLEVPPPVFLVLQNSKIWSRGERGAAVCHGPGLGRAVSAHESSLIPQTTHGIGILLSAGIETGSKGRIRGVPERHGPQQVSRRGFT